MSTYTQIIYQIVFGTRNRRPTLTSENRNKLFMYISGILKAKNCHLYQINGIADHIHILMSLHPSVALANLVKDIKLASTEYIKSENLFPQFNGWQQGYGAFTYAVSEKDRLIRYIINQEIHHHKKSFKKEYIEILNEHKIEFVDKYLFDSTPSGL
jgi:putative transposase